VDLGNQPGYYTVKPGDNLIRIGLENGQNWRDIARWNQLENPNRIEVGQVLRVIPPSAAPVAAPAKPGAVVVPVAGASSAPFAPGVATAPVTGSAVAAQPLPAAGTAPAPAAAPSAAAPAATAAAAAAAPAKPAAAASDDITFIWPAAGSVVAGFDEQKNKGLGIAGKAGEPVLAAAEGRVVYAGSGLRGYGNLIILKHNNTYLTAYAHNQTLLVKEDQNVKQGQKIAEMGNSDADRVKLHFEIRRNGKPVDPAKFLPSR
jgi:lipoprotein NlpD